ncbi:MAG: hypothetical protein NPIRA01_30070 [Nitrospirales bacterium]|nr:MAG: hypothetical protein NPIRA01_30070 [Nitrospirales bacterium]
MYKAVPFLVFVDGVDTEIYLKSALSSFLILCLIKTFYKYTMSRTDAVEHNAMAVYSTFVGKP